MATQMLPVNFIEKMRNFASDEDAINAVKNKLTEEKHKAFVKRQSEIKHEKLEFLTAKYYWGVRNSIEHASKLGLKEKYMNFDRLDFKADFPGLGNPRSFQRCWLDEMCNPESAYVPVNLDTGKQDHFQGLNFDVWNNGAFTTHFTW